MAKARILVVEDESVVAKDIQIRLRGLGYTVSGIASSGEGAIQKAAKTHPDLVLMDIVLSGDMDGIEAAQEIISRYDIPVVYLTAYADEKKLQRAKITEPFGYVLKPFEEKEVYSAIEIALYKHRAETKLKENERWLSTILKSIGDGLIVANRDGFVTFMNPVAESLTGWKQEKALGKHVKEVFHVMDEEKRVLSETLIAKVFQDGSGVNLANQILLGSKDGTEIAIDVSATPIMDDRGNGTGSVVVFRDISEQKLLQRQLQQAEKMQAVGTLASGMAHEFNNSLGAIHGYAQLLAKEVKIEHPMDEYLQKISAKCKQAAELVQRILNYSRPDVGKRVPVQVNQVVKEVQRFLRQTLPPQIELESKLQGNLPFVMAAPTQLEQILLNLVMNALDAMPRGGKIHFKSHMVEPDERFRRAHVWAKRTRYVEVMVKDTGEGIPPEVLERVFDPFFTTKEPGKGTGLGLSIAYSILENSGGHILAESQMGRGSCFRIYLPAMEEEVKPGG